MLSSFSGQTSGRSLVRSLNHGITYLFPRAISAVVLAKIITVSANIFVHVLLTAYKRAGKEKAMRSSKIRQGDRDPRSSTASSPASVTTRVRLSFRKRERSSDVLLTVASSRPWPLARAA